MKEIVDRHHGWVQVEGKKDEGACFTIHLPLYDPEAEARQNMKAGRTGRQKPVKPKENKNKKSREH